MSAGTHECPVTGCNVVELGREVLMCKAHWFSVPKQLRDEVWRTYRAYTRGRGSLGDYVEARDAAIEAAEQCGAQESLL